MYLKNNSIGTLFILVAFLSSCANKTSPTGGPKDEDPPVLELSVPENKALNYTDQKITLEFDEYIKLNNPKEEIIITPRLLGEYEIKTKKNKVIIQIEDTLLSNTTYTLSFREGIQDLNEGNSPENLQLAFSTGDYLDSLSISGNVYHLLTNAPGKNITISLYDTEDTLDVFNSPPIYFTKSTAKGDFIFNNLKNGEYNIYAINDKNKNLILESKNETYAYLDKSVRIDSNLFDIKLPLISLDVTPLELQSSRTRGHYFVLKYNKYVSSFELNGLDPQTEIPPTSFSEDHREIIFYNTNSFVDSLGLIIQTYDTINNSVVDTAYVKFAETKRDRTEYDIAYSKITTTKESPLIKLEVNFSKPTTILHSDSIFFEVDSVQQIPLDTSNFTWNIQHTQLTILKQLDKKLFEAPPVADVPSDTSKNIALSKPLKTPDKRKTLGQKPDNSLKQDSTKAKASPPKNNDPRMYFGTAAFLSVEQDSSIFNTEKLTFINPSSMGIIHVQVDTGHPSYYIQLIDNKGSVVAERYNEKKFTLDNTKPGDYEIRVLIDRNQDNKWNIGDVTKSILPEPVHFYTSEEGTTKLTLRANWELGPIKLKF